MSSRAVIDLSVIRTERERVELHASASIGRRPGLDLVRAIAISLVLVCHFGLVGGSIIGHPFPAAGIATGIFGVEIFFALSGFLIGTLLLRIIERKPDARDWLIFMTRRWMRTLPLYLLWIGLSVVVDPPDTAHPIGTAVAYAALMQNLAWPSVGGNWFGVSWSLSVEEWFYLLFSGVLMIWSQVDRSRAMFATCVLFIASPLLAGLGFRVFGHMPDSRWDEGFRKVVAFRLDAIAFGAVIAIAHHSATEFLFRWRYALLIAGTAIIALAWAQYFGLYEVPQPLLWTSYLSIVDIGAALCLPAAIYVRIDSPFWAALVKWLSERSYGLYIVHLSLIVVLGSWFLHVGFPPLPSLPCALVLSLLFADLSFRYFETPILRARPRQERRSYARERSLNALAQPSLAILTEASVVDRAR